MAQIIRKSRRTVRRTINAASAADAETWLNDPEHGPVVTIRDDKGNVRSHGPAPQLAIAEQSAKEAVRLAKSLRL